MQLFSTLLARVIGWVEDKKEEGQTLVEYALIIALVSIALVVALGLLADGIQGVFDDIIAAFGGS